MIELQRIYAMREWDQVIRSREAPPLIGSGAFQSGRDVLLRAPVPAQGIGCEDLHHALLEIGAPAHEAGLQMQRTGIDRAAAHRSGSGKEESRKEMTNYLDRAERAYDHGASDDRVSALALLSIAQQLRIMNLIAMDEIVVREGTRIGPSLYMPGDKPDHLRPNVAEALGIKEEK